MSQYKKAVCGAIAFLVLFGAYQLGANSVSKSSTPSKPRPASVKSVDVEKNIQRNVDDISSAVSLKKPTKFKTAASNRIDAAKRILNRYGLNVDVVATSLGHSSAGMIAIVEDKGGAQDIVVIDEKNRRAGSLDINKLDIKNNGILEADIHILNDVKDADRDSGVWMGTTHTLPILAEFKEKANGEFEPGMIRSAYKANRKFDQYLMEQKNVDLVNLLITEISALKRDYKLHK